ncbi:hypothetical protein EsH8_X_000466 [Colletotrichum jinshuiense]
MCYRVHTHTMACDVRPVISSTKTLYANPYDAPPNCDCVPRARPRSARCPSHGCCRLDVAVYRCPRRCRQPTNYHKYVCARDEPRGEPPSSPHRRPHSSPRRASTPGPPRAPWRRLRTFDRAPDFHAAESADFRFALAELVDIGRILVHAEAELDKAARRAERERARHRGVHGGACERVLREWECGWARRIAEMATGADDLRLSAEVLADCWVKYVGLLRGYEGAGQRRVGGIVEDRGRRRDASRPWRLFRRESWERGGGGREGRREGERGRERERERERRRSDRSSRDTGERRRSRRGSPDAERGRSWWRT